MARYENRPVGVFDRDVGVVVTTADPSWREYQDWLKAGNAPDSMPVAVRPLAARRLEVIAQVTGIRRDMLDSLTVTVDTFVWKADTESSLNLNMLATKVLAGWSMPADFTWRTADNQLVPFTPARLNRVLTAALTKREAIYRKSWTLKDVDIPTSDNPESIDLAAGWPS